MHGLRLIPDKLISFLVGRLARIEQPRVVVKLLIRLMAKLLGLNLSEALLPVTEYNSVQDLFTRQLKTDARPLSTSNIVSPVDGKLTQYGKIIQGSLIQAKRHTYSLNEFLYDLEAEKRYQAGSYFTFYLAPPDYHRVHIPFSGQLKRACLLPGSLWPVNTTAVKFIPNLFVRNERVVLTFATEFGEASLVMIGALNVGSIRLNFDETLRSNDSLRAAFGYEAIQDQTYLSGIDFEKGDELGMFCLGSSVVLLLPQELAVDYAQVKAGVVKMGQVIF